MNDPEFQKAYAEQNRRDQITYSTLASVLSIILNLFCSVMDYFVYGDKPIFITFVKLRACSVLVVALVWAWFRSPLGRNHHRIFGIMWYASPLVIILWMIYAANDLHSPYYAGLNIILLAVGLLSPWTYVQNLISAVLVLVMYVVVSMAMQHPQPISVLVNNTTFLVLTAVIVVGGSIANARQRYREFELRWELDKNRRIVEETNDKLKKLDEVKSRFFANISHELRTPLTLLLAPLETLLHRFNRSFDEDVRGLLTTMRANGMRLLKLINDLLDLVRLESGRMEVKQEPVEIAHLINGLASAARQVAEDKQLKLVTFTDPALGTALVDGDKLEKMVLNLVFNALKFTPSGGTVELRAEKQAEEFVLKVVDTGVGISSKNLPFVFDRFWQADGSSRRKFQGVGIGLALVKELAEIQDGTVDVQSEEGKGTTFTVRLPYRKAEPALALRTIEASPAPDAVTGQARTVSSEEWLSNLYRRAELFPTMTTGREAGAPVKSAAASTNGRHRKILVADDEPDMLRFLKSQLSAHYEVVEAIDGQQAIDKASEALPDIILLDMMMPEKDGLQACRELRERTPTQSIPIVLLTARADEETKLAALSAGASDFLAKPFSTTELHVRLKNLAEAYEFQKKLAKQNQVLEQTIEQLKETETQLVQSEKMASLGRLSAGIIHEINNPLNFATTGLFTLRNKDKYLAESQREEYVDILKDVEEGIGRVKDIVSGLRSFSYAGDEHRDEIGVADVVSAALKFLSHEWKDQIDIHLNIPEGQTISGNRNKLIQVLLNLVQNSLDALARKSFAEGKPSIWIECRTENNKILLSVRDNGTGIEPENMGKIFDPFFTTKDVGEGMGLGLSISYRIVQEFDGRIHVKSEPGQYCEFVLEFPVVKEPASAGVEAE